MIATFKGNNVEVEVAGTEELLRTLKRLDPSLAENGLRQGVNAVARQIVIAARKNLAPHKRTGTLSKSLGTSSRIDRRTRSVTAKAKTSSGKGKKYDGFYGRFLEFGTIHIAPIAFMSRAGEEVTPRANQIIRQHIAKNLPKIIAKAKRKGII